ncbi:MULTISPECIES: N-acetyl-gamma-glutamyl-phosphate reductase [Helicobacter]|uniref:N-acetyl-gamma-glutamyl-phosphate reductase n=1 Tax=Helicobacter typhlonius TaxID=76936 RepID=A0A099UF02_9HELI|nr:MULTISPECIES: N-acetyl-gamma-glutamyl-phosphate reductase [Helicobacter]TLD78222.1 N-acetyl-gamma-glutamyl-phosphate reductase [Helicobacter typhlonius]TLD86875.1 N-acetyl-gamma-glutamyl-phosphate reductase [Helicobacter sp. MIT 03-1616]CUU40704.1 N-acetyl-gamma-glutamyl-phosphate reductase [Helicobacter typhlonius]HCD73294.1 N-acetyl-gamma-glutamyl-phosphate reductase [Helicobacter sp.]
MLDSKIKVGIIGVSGYTGLELVKLLVNHPIFTLVYVANSQGGGELGQIHKMLMGLSLAHLPIHKADAKEALQSCELLFLALPHKSAMEMAKEIFTINPKAKVVDLSADYRLNALNYEANYCPHIDKENLSHAVYGLPEYNRESIKKAHLIANPGCYPTATLLALLPFAPYIDINCGVFVDAKSGVSGAGKGFSETSHFSHINENLFSYSPLTHRHQIEISQKCGDIVQRNFDIVFVPHLTPLTRGMLVSVFATLNSTLSAQEAKEVLTKAYENEPFIRIRDKPVSIAQVVGSHFCDIFVATRDKNLYINSSIDNLLRGASSQALANANLMCGLDEGLGMPKVPYGIF